MKRLVSKRLLKALFSELFRSAWETVVVMAVVMLFKRYPLEIMYYAFPIFYLFNFLFTCTIKYFQEVSNKETD